MKTFPIILLISCLAASPAQSMDQEKLNFFESKIRPVLVESCYKCHSVESGKDKGGLLVDSREALLKGGDSGPAIVPGKPQESLLIKAISYKDLDLQMPEKKQLPEKVIKDFEKWVVDGAVDPRTSAKGKVSTNKMADGRRNHWSFQPEIKIKPPKVKNDSWSRSDIDRFVLEKITLKGLIPSDQAAPADLLRRVYYDLIGLPPEPEIIDSFIKTPSEEHYRKIVDNLLNSPQFGVKWARFWLDSARYSETAGGGRSYPVPFAWRYRNYVIDSFNKDVPYNRFLTEQLAGDLLSAETDEEKAGNMTATAFLAIGAKPLDLQNKPQLELDHVDEQMDTLGKLTMGMTIGCARCHDHAFDPITTKDYYQMAAIFQNTVAMVKANISRYSVLPLPGCDEKGVKEAVDNIEKFRGMGRNISDLERKIQAGQKNLLEKKEKLEKQFHQLILTDSQKPVTLGVEDSKKFKDGFIRIRGQADNLGQKVNRSGPMELISKPLPNPVPENASGRLQLAEWITHPEHPLTGRVYVNRIWAQLFGKGIVASLDNFGTTGNAPTHPELLDYLSRNFKSNNWSTKNLVKEIVLSSTYRQSIKETSNADKVDADNELLSFFPRKRLSAEAIRDTILQVSGLLEEDLFSGQTPWTEMQTSKKRSIFLPTLREEGRNDLLDVFDFPDASASTGERNVTNLPSQSLFLMNSPFVIKQAEVAAARLLNIGDGLSTTERLHQAGILVFGRKLKEDEFKVLSSHLESNPNAVENWSTVFHAMFCSVNFRFLN